MQPQVCEPCTTCSEPPNSAWEGQSVGGLPTRWPAMSRSIIGTHRGRVCVEFERNLDVALTNRPQTTGEHANQTLCTSSGVCMCCARECAIIGVSGPANNRPSCLPACATVEGGYDVIPVDRILTASKIANQLGAGETVGGRRDCVTPSLRERADLLRRTTFDGVGIVVGTRGLSVHAELAVRPCSSAQVAKQHAQAVLRICKLAAKRPTDQVPYSLCSKLHRGTLGRTWSPLVCRCLHTGCD